jgi:hypothetical protein
MASNAERLSVSEAETKDLDRLDATLARRIAATCTGPYPQGVWYVRWMMRAEELGVPWTAPYRGHLA